MFRLHTFSIQLIAGLILLFIASPNAMAADYFFTFGGGYSPHGNQISLEKNVQYFQRMLAAKGHADSPQHYLFADGNDPNPDLQFKSPPAQADQLHLLLGQMLGSSSDLEMKYRSHQVERVAGTSSKQSINDYFLQTASKLGAEDRLIIYYTGHGGRGPKGAPNNTSLELWNHEKLRMQEFVKTLDQVPAEVPVVVIMVQCFSGGFANMIFEDGDATKDVAAHNRVGFFATVHDRVAAGCTPNIDEADYQEYSTFFWAAIFGQTRLGEPVDTPDFDSDGRVSFVEAHAYTLLYEDAIDISIKTSDAFLRKYSKLEDRSELFDAQTHYARLAAIANPVDRAVLEGLSNQLSLDGAYRIKNAVELSQNIEADRKQLAGDRKNLLNEYNGLKKKIKQTLLNRWPELSNAWHPRVHELLTHQSDELLEAITSHPHYQHIDAIGIEINAIDDQRQNLEHQWVKCKRLIRTAENVAYAHNLAKVAEPEIIARYEQLIAAENQTLSTPSK